MLGSRTGSHQRIKHVLQEIAWFCLRANLICRDNWSILGELVEPLPTSDLVDLVQIHTIPFLVGLGLPFCIGVLFWILIYLHCWSGQQSDLSHSMLEDYPRYRVILPAFSAKEHVHFKQPATPTNRTPPWRPYNNHAQMFFDCYTSLSKFPHNRNHMVLDFESFVVNHCPTARSFPKHSRKKMQYFFFRSFTLLLCSKCTFIVFEGWKKAYPALNEVRTLSGD
jgi:hypothetical protein